VICLEAADKYVTVVRAAGEAQVRAPPRELACGSRHLFRRT
jgi:hypothetical protein